MSEDPQALFQKLYVEQQMLESNINSMQQHMELIQVSLNSYKAGLSVLDELGDRKAGEEVLLNVGGAIFVEAKLVDPTKVTRGIGSGIRIVQTQKEAQEQLSQTVQTLEKRLESLQQEYQSTVARAQAVNATLQQLASRVQPRQTDPKQDSSAEE